MKMLALFIILVLPFLQMVPFLRAGHNFVKMVLFPNPVPYYNNIIIISVHFVVELNLIMISSHTHSGSDLSAIAIQLGGLVGQNIIIG